MSRVLVCSEDALSSMRIGRLLADGHHAHDIVKTPISQENLLLYDLVLFHSSYRLSGLTQFIERLVLSRTIPVVFISSTIGIGSYRMLMNNPYFVSIDEHKLDSELPPTIRLLGRFVPELKRMSAEVQKAEVKVESEKLMQKCKKQLMTTGLTEEAAHQYILKIAMDHQLSKHDACTKILGEFGK